MACTVLTLIVDLTRPREQVAAAIKSVDSVRSAITSDGPAQSLCSAFADAGMLLDDPADLLWCEPVDRTAVRAGKLDLFEIKPSDRYVELVTAIASHGNEYAIRVRHGWPILSSVCCSTTIAEAGGVASALGGGLAA